MKIRKTLRIGIPLGDPGGVGPEIVIRALQDSALKEMFTPILYGSGRVLSTYRKMLSIERFSYNVIDSPSQSQPKKVHLVESGQNFEHVEVGRPSKEGGKIALESLQNAVRDLKSEELDAIVTMPIDKKSIQADDFQFPGHTEYLTEAFDVPDTVMLMTSEFLKVGVVTGHLPINKVSDALSISKIIHKIKLLNTSLKNDFNIQKPKIAVLGLNPHAGDNGLLGTEEKEIIGKAVAQASVERVLVMGPYSADGFFGSGMYRQFDATLAMYHDQGLIPFKLMAGFEGVNFTAGLPAVRTSPDHGVAYDLAGKGEADLTSFQQAIFAAIDIYRNRTENEFLQAGAMPPSKDKPRRERPSARPDMRTGERRGPRRDGGGRKSAPPPPENQPAEVPETPEPPQVEPATVPEPPKAEAPKVETPKAEAPKADPPVAETPPEAGEPPVAE